MTDPTPRSSQDALHQLNRRVSVNQLTAACEAAAPAMKAIIDMLGDSAAPETRRLFEAIRNYQGTRTDTDRARDLFLSRFPTAEVMQEELDRRRDVTP